MKFKYTAEEKATLWLDSFDLTYRQKEELLATCSAMDLIRKLSVDDEQVRSLSDKKTYMRMRAALGDENYLPELLSELEERDIFFVTPDSADYPPQIKNIPVRPMILYCKGNRRLLTTEHFSIVGSRRILPWAKKLTERVAGSISEHFTIVTGFAEGGDEGAIRGAMSQSDGEVNLICVLANGFDHVYPAAHSSLQREVAERGLLVSEFRPSVRPQKFLFPIRNRIIAGMSRGLLVAAAGKRSGTAVTAGYALEYGRDVFAFPYNPGIAEGEGCNGLIKSGAFLATCAEDILSVYGISEKRKPMPEITEAEGRVIAALRESGELHVEQLSERLSLPPYEISALLAGLEIKGLVVRSGGNRYACVGAD